MPTNDERREVAEKLRERTKKPMGKSMQRMFTETLGMYQHNICWMNPDKATARWDTIVNYLADLIEPEERTCRVVTEMRALSQMQDMHTKSCSSCGYVFGSEEHRQLLPGLGERVAINPVRIPKFCPNCGARVVDAE